MRGFYPRRRDADFATCPLWSVYRSFDKRRWSDRLLKWYGWKSFRNYVVELARTVEGILAEIVIVSCRSDRHSRTCAANAYKTAVSWRKKESG